MAVYSVETAIRDTVAAWLESLAFTDGASSYGLETVRGRHPAPDNKVTLPAVALILSGRYDNRTPVEVPGSRDPEKGTGTYLETTGEFDGEVTLVVFAADDDQADQVVGGLEQALCPTTQLVPRVVLTATDYHGQTVTLRRRAMQTALWKETSGQSVWRPIITCGVSCSVVRERVAEDLLPRLDLTPTPGAEITLQIDPAEGTTTETATEE